MQCSNHEGLGGSGYLMQEAKVTATKFWFIIDIQKFNNNI
jgi:hypothetical protein